MKHLIFNLFAVAALSAAPGKQTFTGTITDNMCVQAGPTAAGKIPTLFDPTSGYSSAKSREVRFSSCGSHLPIMRLIGIGAAVARCPLPHHRAYGTVHGGSRWLR